MQVITKIGVVSLAKVMGMSGVLIGLIVGVLYGGIAILIGLIGAAASGGNEQSLGFGALGIVGGLMAMVLVPIFYGLTCFIFGLIYGLIINLVLHMAGGLELEIQNKTS